MNEQFNKDNKKVFPLIFKKKVNWFAFSGIIVGYNIVLSILLFSENGSFIDNENKDGLFLLLYNNLSPIIYLLLIISIITIIISLKFEFKGKNKVMLLPETNYMLKCSLVHTIAVYGVVIFFISENFNHLLLFTTLSLIGMFLHYPKRIDEDASSIREII